jgi:hypothetical protein
MAAGVVDGGLRKVFGRFGGPSVLLTIADRGPVPKNADPTNRKDQVIVRTLVVRPP